MLCRRHGHPDAILGSMRRGKGTPSQPGSVTVTDLGTVKVCQHWKLGHWRVATTTPALFVWSWTLIVRSDQLVDSRAASFMHMSLFAFQFLHDNNSRRCGLELRLGRRPRFVYTSRNRWSAQSTKPRAFFRRQTESLPVPNQLSVVQLLAFR